MRTCIYVIYIYIYICVCVYTHNIYIYIYIYIYTQTQKTIIYIIYMYMDYDNICVNMWNHIIINAITISRRSGANSGWIYNTHTCPAASVASLGSLGISRGHFGRKEFPLSGQYYFWAVSTIFGSQLCSLGLPFVIDRRCGFNSIGGLWWRLQLIVSFQHNNKLSCLNPNQ